MGRRRKTGRKVNGILLFDKPLGVSSNKALQGIKSLFHAQKAGHTGSLDPLATGLLPICFGEATKLSAYLLDADKHYEVTVQLGEKTETGDTEGEVIQTLPSDHISQADVEAALVQFRGEIQQLPPMYSALKHKGQRLYKLARQGIVVEREPRTVVIHALEMTHFETSVFQMTVHCSKGTYVRTLAEDIGESLACGAHITALRRTGVGVFDQEGMLSVEELESIAESDGLTALDQKLLPMDTALSHWPDVHLTADASFYLRQGQAVLVPKAPTSGLIRLYDNGGIFIGVGEIQDDGMVAPRRLFESKA